jgi:hypothetical protein
MTILKHLVIGFIVLAGCQTAAIAKYVPPFVIVPFKLEPDNIELTIPEMPLGWPQSVKTDLWGAGGKCGIGCAVFSGNKLSYGDGLSFDNLKIEDIFGPGAVKVTQIVWTCGKDKDGAGIPCSPPVPIYSDGPIGPIRHDPSEQTPVFMTIIPVPEPASWALMIAGFAMVGGALRRRAAVGATV